MCMKEKVNSQKGNRKSVKKVAKSNIDVLLQKNNLGIKLDIGCGANKQEGFVGIDIRELPGVDIVHNIEQFPWPLPDKSVSMAVASHVLEHINPASTDPRLVGLIRLLKSKKLISDKEITEFIGESEVFGVFMRFMDEVWRILKVKGRFAFVSPYPNSIGFVQDPTHLNLINEATLAYFDPLDRSGLWAIYKPKPWKIVESYFDLGGNLEVVLEKRLIDKSYEPQT